MHFSKRYYSLDQYCNCLPVLKRLAKVLCSSACERALFYLSAVLFFCRFPGAVAGVVLAETLYTTNVVFIIRRTFTQG